MQIIIDTSQPFTSAERDLLNDFLTKATLLSGATTIVTEPAEKPATPARRSPAKSKPAPEPEPEDEDLLGDDEPEVTKEALVKLVTEAASAGHGKAIKEILTKHGAAKVSLLDADEYGAVFAEVSAL